ncbi:unnamed protein product, partial [Rotaria magnacalcarata]
NNPESLFARRSPSPRTSEPLTNATKLVSSSSNVNIQQQSLSTHKYHRYLATPSEEQEIQ